MVKRLSRDSEIVNSGEEEKMTVVEKLLKVKVDRKAKTFYRALGLDEQRFLKVAKDVIEMCDDEENNLNVVERILRKYDDGELVIALMIFGSELMLRNIDEFLEDIEAELGEDEDEEAWYIG